MPRGEQRQQTAAARASGTISTLIESQLSEDSEEQDEMTPQPQVVNMPKAEEADPKPKKKEQAQDEEVIVNKKSANDDFFDYLARLNPGDFTATGACVYVYKQAQSGNVQIDRLYRPLTFEELKNSYAARHGAGNYYVQFTTRNKNLSNCGQRFTFDGDSLSVLGEGQTGVLERGALSSSAQATSEAIKMVAEASREANKANIELITQITKDNIRPQQDSITPLIITLLDNQRKESAERAERDRKDAADRAERDREDLKAQAKRDLDAATTRAERDNKFFQLLMDNSEKRAQEREGLVKQMNDQQTKFFEALLKEKERKEPWADIISNMFNAFAEEKLSGGGNETLPGWAGVIQTALPRVADAVSTFMAVRAGASPQQIQQLQAAQAQNSAVEQGLNPAPTAPLQTADNQLMDFINRLGNYITSHENPDVEYMLSVISEEYGPIEDYIFRTPQDQIVSLLQNNALGQQLIKLPNAGAFIQALINGIKTPQPEILDDGQQQATGRPHKRQVAEEIIPPTS